MFINFDHNGQVLPAKIKFDFNQIKNALLITPLVYNKELGESILFMKNENEWSPDQTFAAKFPLTSESLLMEINNNFHRIEAILEVYYQQYLS